MKIFGEVRKVSHDQLSRVRRRFRVVVSGLLRRRFRVVESETTIPRCLLRREVGRRRLLGCCQIHGIQSLLSRLTRRWTLLGARLRIAMAPRQGVRGEERSDEPDSQIAGPFISISGVDSRIAAPAIYMGAGRLSCGSEMKISNRAVPKIQRQLTRCFFVKNPENHFFGLLGPK